MPMEVYYEKLVEHLQEAKDRFVFSPEDEGVHHIALKLYAYAHYATIRDCLGIPTDIKYECPKGYYPFDLLVSGLSYIDPDRNIGIECISRKSYLLRPSIIEEKISKAHYHLRMHDISRFEIYLEPSFETEKTLRNIADKIRTFGEFIACKVPTYRYDEFVEAAEELRFTKDLEQSLE
ncbi:MAG: hypothetical protein QXK93_01715 [Candidatus Bathyarchaeia archaeon]